MAGTKISALAAATTLDDADLLTAVDVSAGTNVKITTTNTAAAIFARIEPTLPFVTVSGLVEGGTGNNTSAINAALNACEAAGGGLVVLPAGNYGWSGTITVPQWVDLQGAGGGWSASPTNHMTRLVATGAGAKIVFESSGGTSGSFVVDGDDTATGPIFHRVLGAERCFQSIHIRQSAGEAWRIDEAQNDTWINIQSYGNTGASLVMDNGCGGHLFMACEIAGSDDWHLIITETTGTGPYLTVGPSHNTWDHCLFEYGKGGTFDGCVDIHSGHRNVFRDCVFSASGFITSSALVRTNTDAAGGAGTSSVEFNGCWFFGADSGTRLGILQTAGIVRVTGNSEFQEMTTAWTYNGGTAYMSSAPVYPTVTNRWAGSGSVATIINPSGRPIEVRGESTDTYMYRAIQQGDTGTRLDITAAGALSWGSGTGAPDTAMYRSAANTLTVLTGDSLTIDGTWNTGTFRWGTNYVWVDTIGQLRIKASAPASATDGTVVGQQADQIYLTEQNFVTQGAAAPGFIGQHRGFLFDAAAAETISAPFIFPASWVTATFELYWTNGGAGSGNVVWRFTTDTVISGGSVATVGGNIDCPAATAPAQNILAITAGPSALTLVAGAQYSIDITRLGADAGDTLANDAGLLGVMLKRAT